MQSGTWNLLCQEHEIVGLEDDLAIMMMGSKDCYLNKFLLFTIVLICNAVKDSMMSHLDLILGP
jgi:hypothetical protein